MTPFTAPIPLRSSTIWGGYRVAEPIPHRYGYVTGSLIQYNATRTQFVWADHAVSNISDVTIDDQPAEAWAFSNAIDVTGHAVAMVTFNQPVDEGATPVARGVGKLHPSTGALMESPATVVWDLLANIAGRDIAETELDDFRNACARLGITVSGSITDGGASVQGVAREICASIGAVFSAGMRGWCRVYPGGELSPAVATVGDFDGVSAVADLGDLANDITIEFAHTDGSPRQTLQVESVESVARYGRRSMTHSAPWISSNRVALDVASRLLKHRARRVWSVSAGGLSERVRVGDVITLDSVRLPVPGDYMALATELDLDTEKTAIRFEVPVGAAPMASLVRTATAFTRESYAALGVEAVGSDYVITLREEDGRAMVGAAVTLDGSITRYTDSAGRVAFPANLMTAGEHTFRIVTADGRTLTTVVTV